MLETMCIHLSFRNIRSIRHSDIGPVSFLQFSIQLTDVSDVTTVRVHSKVHRVATLDQRVGDVSILGRVFVCGGQGEDERVEGEIFRNGHRK